MTNSIVVDLVDVRNIDQFCTTDVFVYPDLGLGFSGCEFVQVTTEIHRVWHPIFHHASICCCEYMWIDKLPP